jgi:hypothetical protein
MDPPSCSISYDRAFSLPIGVPEDGDAVAGADLVRYEAELGSQIEFLALRWDAADPFTTVEQPRDPFTGGLRARFLKKSGAAGAVAIPTPLAPGSVASADVGTVRFAPAQLNAVGKISSSPVTPGVGETMSAAMARTFRWDDQERALWAVPQPYFAEQALSLFWPSAAPAPAGAVGVDSPGIFADDTSKYLLKTNAATRDGDLQRDLLRSPVRGLVRVTRYRHIEFTVGATGLSAPLVRAQSSTGAIVLHALPPSASVPTDAGAPILRDTFLVYEHCSLSDASDCVAALWWLQLLRFADLAGVPQLRKGVHSSTAWLFGVYLALGAITPPTVDALGGLAPATLDKLRKVKTPNPAALKEAIDHVLADAGRRSALADFVRNVMAKLACGFSWSELGLIDIPAPPSARTPANRDAHSLLEVAQQAKDVWIAAFAGAPVGRPAQCYGPTPAAAAPGSSIARNGFTTYDLEAFVIAGRAAAAFPAINPPAVPATPDQLVSLGGYAAVTSGRFALLRIADGAPGSIAYTIKDWLGHLVSGWQRTSAAEAPVDFSNMLAAGHPLAAALDSARRKRARDLRFSLDQVNGATNAAGRSLDKAALAWWVGVVHFTAGGDPSKWPIPTPPSTPPAFSDAGPEQPSRIGETASAAAVSGFDEEDLALALEAAEHLRSGGDTTKPVDLALVLALLDREGYRLAGPFMRQGPFDPVFRDNLNLVPKSAFAPAAVAPPVPRGAMQGIGRHFYALQTYGLDVLDRPHFPPTGFAGVHNWLKFAWDNLFSLITDATMVGVVTGLDTLALDGATLSRITSRFRPVGDIGQSGVLSRRLHLAGIIAQHGEFQRRHLLLRQGSTAGPLGEFWQPSAGGVRLADVPQFTATAAPAAGANAEDAARADYLAYYALCYLAFNASPSVWNSWVGRAVALGAAANAPRFLLYRITDADSAGGGRELWHRGNFVRFTVGLDAYLRMSDTGAGDLVFPVRAGWPV